MILDAVRMFTNGWENLRFTIPPLTIPPSSFPQYSKLGGPLSVIMPMTTLVREECKANVLSAPAKRVLRPKCNIVFLLPTFMGDV